MQNSLNIVCDFCAEVLEGKKGIADVQKDHISVKGSVCLTTFDKETDWIDYTYLADKQHAASSFMHFCVDKNKNCMMDYILARKFLRKQRMMNEVPMGDNDYGYDYRTKPLNG